MAKYSARSHLGKIFQTTVIKHIKNACFYDGGRIVLTGSCTSILNGFVIEKISSGVRVWQFLYPLFDSGFEGAKMSDSIHLTYSQPVKPDREILGCKVSASEFASNFVLYVNHMVHDSEIDHDYASFMSHLLAVHKQRGGGPKENMHPNRYLAIIYCRVLLEDIDEARSMLDGIESLELYSGLSARKLSTLKMVQQLFHNDPDDAISYLKTLVLENRKRFNIVNG